MDRREPKNYVKCLQRILALADRGHELDRPLAAHLGDGIYELRIRRQRVNYRMLYFFHGRNVAVLTHGFTKEKEVPPQEIRRAKDSRTLVTRDFKKHTAEWEV
ncbi:MAG: type II toxin-antitoxin system RelE/ParE family toxin [Pirellulales bacterium]